MPSSTKPQEHALELHPHPESPIPWARSLRAQVSWKPGEELALDFLLEGDLTQLKVPSKVTSERRDRLWEHTCFEAFLSPVGRTEYMEFNYAPSTQWAAYAFSDYRRRSADPELAAPHIRCTRDAQRLELKVKLDLKSDGFPKGPLRLGLTAVMESEEGSLSYWALAHGPGKPDFHRSETFTAGLD